MIDVGQHQMWAAQSIDVRKDQRFLTSGGMGSMGFALPAAVGAAIATGRPVVMVAGDGSFSATSRNCRPWSETSFPSRWLW